MKDLKRDQLAGPSNSASKVELNNAGSQYVSPSPGEFPILGSTICVDKNNPTREEFLTARECGLSAGSSEVSYSYNDANVSSSELTTKFEPAMINTGVGLIVNNACLIIDNSLEDPFDNSNVAASYKIRMNYTMQQSFVTGLDVFDEPSWKALVASGETEHDKYVPGKYTKIYRHTESVMDTVCNTFDVPLRELHINLVASIGNEDEDNPGYYSTIGRLPNYYVYLQKVEDLIHPQCWSFDYYPASIGKNDDFGLASNLKELYGFLDRFLQISYDTDRPFRMIGLATEFETGGGFHQATPTINRLRFQAFMALAYGAQEIQYWTYCQRYHSDHPEEDKIFSTEFYISSPINRLGEKNQIWYSLQQVIAEIRKYSSVFRGCRVNYIKHIDNGYESPLKTEMKDGEPYFLEYFKVPLTIDNISERISENYNKIFKGVMISCISTDPDNMSTGYVNNEISSSTTKHTEHYVIIVSHDPDNYKTVTITFDDGYEIEELTPRVLTGNEDPSFRTIVRDLMPGGYLIFRYRKLS